MLRVLFVVSLLLASSAASDPGLDAGVFWPTHGANGPQPAALLDGTLEVSGRCVYIVADHGGRWLGIWPESLVPERVGDRIRIVDASGEVIGIEGERILAGGGERSISGLGGFQAFDGWLEEIGGSSIPRTCGDLTWQVSGVEAGSV